PSLTRIAPTPVAFVIGLLNCVSIERQGGTAAPKGVVTSSMSPLIPDMLWCPGVGRSEQYRNSLRNISEINSLIGTKQSDGP
ncbi:hypothetical protein glysoja_034952, partial [Glycine soja]